MSDIPRELPGEATSALPGDPGRRATGGDAAPPRDPGLSATDPGHTAMTPGGTGLGANPASAGDGLAAANEGSGPGDGLASATGEGSGPADAGGGAFLSRRAALKLLGVLPLAPVLGGSVPFRWTQPEVTQAAGRVAALASPSAAVYAPRFFTAHEYATVRLLADMVLPADEKSGSATDARVPEFMDFMMGDGPEPRRVAFRGGLAWLDAETRRRFGLAFVAASARQRAAILDDIAWPKKAPASLSPGVAFFSAFRDLAAAGFFSSEMGQKDLAWVGNVPVMEWKGCGEAANRHALRMPEAKASS